MAAADEQPGKAGSIGTGQATQHTLPEPRAMRTPFSFKKKKKKSRFVP